MEKINQRVPEAKRRKKKKNKGGGIKNSKINNMTERVSWGRSKVKIGQIIDGIREWIGGRAREKETGVGFEACVTEGVMGSERMTEIENKRPGRKNGSDIIKS